jgi:hypothetical protein
MTLSVDEGKFKGLSVYEILRQALHRVIVSTLGGFIHKTQRTARCSHSCSNMLNPRLAGKISSTYAATPSHA